MTGILHPKSSAKNYNLRRYFPSTALSEWIDQFWFVDWNLPDGIQHQQENLPDPNFHLIYEKNKFKLIGPVSKKYTYRMEGQGEIIGVKFKVAAITHLLNNAADEYVDKTINIGDIFNAETINQLTQLANNKADEQQIAILKTALHTYFNVSPSPAIIQVRQLIQLIQTHPDIQSVNGLARVSNIPVRSIQRSFKQYVGLSPKWLIRKYRLHQALARLENKERDILDIVEQLGYTDQPHLIRDFQEILGVTPSQYQMK